MGGDLKIKSHKLAGWVLAPFGAAVLVEALVLEFMKGLSAVSGMILMTGLMMGINLAFGVYYAKKTTDKPAQGSDVMGRHLELPSRHHTHIHLHVSCGIDLSRLLCDSWPRNLDSHCCNMPGFDSWCNPPR